MSGYSDLSDDAETWKANFMANIEDIEENYYSDVDAFARSLAAKIPDADELGPSEGREELEGQLDDGSEGLAQLQRIFNDFETNSEENAPTTEYVKRVVVARADSTEVPDDGEVDNDLVMEALDEYADDWATNWSSSFGF